MEKFSEISNPVTTISILVVSWAVLWRSLNCDVGIKPKGGDSNG